MRCKLQALAKHNEMVPCLISFILLPFAQQDQIPALFPLRRYFKNPSGKCKIISGGETCHLRERGQLQSWAVYSVRGVECPSLSPAAVLVRQDFAESLGTCHGCVPCARKPRLCRACLAPLLLRHSSDWRLSHIRQAESLASCTLLPKKSEGLFILWQQKIVVWD